MADNEGCALVTMDEARRLRSMGQYKKGGDDEEVVMEMFNGNNFKILRKGPPPGDDDDDESGAAPHCCLRSARTCAPHDPPALPAS